MPTTSKINSNIWRGKLSKKDQERIEGIPYKKLGITSFFISLLIVILVITFQRNLPPEVPLFYGLPKGSDQITTSLILVLPSIISMIIVVVNLLIAFVIDDDFLKKVLVLAAVLSVFFSSITTIKIILLIGSF